MNQRGSVLPLVAGLLSLAVVFAIAVIDSTDLAITRTELQSVADGAALAAAQSVSPANAKVSNGRLVISLRPAIVTQVARRFIADSTVSGVRLQAATTTDGRTATVTTATVWRPPLASELLPLRVRLTASARARTIFS